MSEPLFEERVSYNSTIYETKKEDTQSAHFVGDTEDFYAGSPSRKENKPPAAEKQVHDNQNFLQTGKDKVLTPFRA